MRKRYKPSISTARDKLNSAHLIGAFVFASIVDAATGSWLAFFLAAGIVIGLSIHSGGIRLT
ncbi:MAG: hypothetical protein GX621_11120 [Pirellulaceae bacterium]|nr:hypothetical protein [Pirellulaceae bacterium]